MIGNIIKSERLKRNLTREEMTAICGISHHQIFRIENGKVIKPHLDTIKKLADFFDLDFRELAEEADYSFTDLANLVVVKRIELELTQNEFAQKYGIGLHLLQRIETGETRKPKRQTLRLLTEVLNLTEEEIMEIAGYHK